MFDWVDMSGFLKMDKIEYRAVIKYLFLKGNTPKKIKDELDSVYGDSAPSFTTVKFWVAQFKRGRKSLGDDERLGRPKTATTDENIAKVQQMVLDHGRIKVREIAEVMNMSKERVCFILNQHLDMRKLSKYETEEEEKPKIQEEETIENTDNSPQETGSSQDLLENELSDDTLDGSLLTTLVEVEMNSSFSQSQGIEKNNTGIEKKDPINEVDKEELNQDVITQPSSSHGPSIKPNNFMKYSSEISSFKRKREDTMASKYPSLKDNKVQVTEEKRKGSKKKIKLKL